jgi:phage tail sheath protein FI
MPEYLAPGVYVEEIDTGNKPIEGVSTSTTGMVGATERGPINYPILLTSYGEYVQWFGERLPFDDFGDHCYLPYAVDGFFTNGGKRLYLTRVIDTAAAVASTADLYYQSATDLASTILLRVAGEDTGTVANPPLLYVLDPGQIVTGKPIRIGDGSESEYRKVTAKGADQQHVPLSFPINLSHTTGAANDVEQFPRGADVGGGKTFTAAYALDQDATAGEAAITISGAAADIATLKTLLAGGTHPLLEIGAAGAGEHRFAGGITVLTGKTARVTLNGGAPVLSYKAGTAVTPLEVTGFAQVSTLKPNAAAGDRLIYVDTVGTLTTRGDLVIIDRGTHSAEVRRIGDLATIDLSTGPDEPYPAASIVQQVTMGDDNRSLQAGVVAGATSLTITGDDVSFLLPGTSLRVGVPAKEEDVTVTSVDPSVTPHVVHIAATGFANAHNAGDPVVPDFSRKTLGANVAAGGGVIVLANRVSLAKGDVLRVGDAPADEYAVIESIPSRATTGPDPGNVVLASGLAIAHASGETVRRQTPPVTGAAQPTPLVLAALAASTTLLVSDGNGYAAGAMLSVIDPSGDIFYHRTPSGFTAAKPREITLDAALSRAHDEDSPVVARTPLLDVEALDVGAWGDRLRISVQNENPGLVAHTTLQTVVDPMHIRLGSASGVESGTILEFTDPLNGNAVVGDPVKVDLINRQANFTITLAGGLDAAQQAAQAAAVLVGQRLGVRSREFRITVYLLHPPDPARPSRNDQVIGTELFRTLSLDPRHSRYAPKIIGDTLGPKRLADNRPEGESWYIRVHDPNPTEEVRLGPETLWDILPNGQMRPARHPLSSGDDALGTLTDAIYVGTDAVDPIDRTGLFTLVNIDDVSIIGAPGRTSAVVQNALIAQCENLRYRFAVLDGPPPPDDAIPDVQVQRQQYDTKYAALYYPWLLIEDPYPTNLQDIGTFAIPSSGHVLGVYARTDIDRGVHKAPANEVVQGIIGLQRTINKGEQEILNPFPSNINVIRDFRPNNRAIRIWGARVVTSDPDWIYVNVRRLMIFIEKSIDIGLQWVVFEPNADPLWARVRRTIGDFLTTVWRNGALEGTKREEAYFVKCDRTTMTQADIDNGRLVVVIGVAPVKPAEFVIIRIGLWTAQAQQ